jgi:succinate dehydrogenase / fumarate reductase iron-sulfur subunit
MIEVKVTVTRFDPGRDAAPYPQGYALEVRENQTILDLLLDLAADHDPTVAFRRACRSGICGTCAVTINGVPKLACETLVSEVLDGREIAIGPLPHFRVLKDLVVDIDRFLDSLRNIVPWLVLRPDHQGRMSQTEVRRLEKSAECTLCGVCQADGSVADGDPRAELNPAVLVKAFRLGFDPRDALGAERAKLVRDLGLLNRALDRTGKLGCPKQIDFAGQILPELKRALVTD